MKRYFSVLICALAVLVSACDTADPIGPRAVEDTAFHPDLEVNLEAMTKTASGLYYQDLDMGEGATAEEGSDVGIFYTVWLPGGQQLDTNLGGNVFPFTVGAGETIEGIDEGVRGMQIGGVRKLVLPAELAYDDSVLVFEVQLSSAE